MPNYLGRKDPVIKIGTADTLWTLVRIGEQNSCESLTKVALQHTDIDFLVGVISVLCVVTEGWEGGESTCQISSGTLIKHLAVLTCHTHCLHHPIW